MYFYFHLYLQRLWSDLASLPAVFPDGVALDRKAYPWLLNGLVRAHFKKLERAQRPLTRLENVVSIFLAWWVVPLTLLAFWLRFLPRHDWLGTTLHVVLIAGAAWFGVSSYRLAVQTLSGGAEATEENRGIQPLWLQTWRVLRHYLVNGMVAAAALVAIVLVLSAGAWIDPGNDPLTTFGFESYAHLTDKEVSTKPSAWTGQEETSVIEIAQVKGVDLEGRDLRAASARQAFLVRAKLAFADLSDAFLWQADLRSADLHRADLNRADLRRAALWRADLRGANLRGANLRGTSLRVANLSGASLRGADLRGANLSLANLNGTSLRGADLRGANLSGVSSLSQVQLDLACGDEMTQLSRGLTIRRCTAPPNPSSPPTGSS